MTTREFLSRLRTLDVKIWADGDRLRCNAPKDVLTPDLRGQLVDRKAEILTFLRTAEMLSPIVPIQPVGSKQPFFGVPGHNGDVFCYVPLARRLGRDQPFYALQPPGLDGRRPVLTRVEGLAGYFVEQLSIFQPEGPFLLGGYCMGGVVAFEIARQLRRQGRAVRLLALFETSMFFMSPLFHRIRTYGRHLARRASHHLRTASQLPARDRLFYFLERARRIQQAVAARNRDNGEGVHDYEAQVRHATFSAVRRYTLCAYPGRVNLFLANRDSMRLSAHRLLHWGSFAEGGLDIVVGPDGCYPDNMLLEPNVRVVAEQLKTCLNQAQERSP